jgi:hypothetical protein
MSLRQSIEELVTIRQAHASCPQLTMDANKPQKPYWWVTRYGDGTAAYPSALRWPESPFRKARQYMTSRNGPYRIATVA